jgi:hypothetical protein
MADKSEKCRHIKMKLKNRNICKNTFANPRQVFTLNFPNKLFKYK